MFLHVTALIMIRVYAGDMPLQGLTVHSWTHQDCPASTLYYDLIPPTYFDRQNNLSLQQIQSEVEVNDIIMWGTNGSAHAAYVTNVYGGIPELIMIHEVRQEGGPELTIYSLQDEIEYRGNPTGYARKVDYDVTFKNNFNDGVIKIDGTQYSSPKTKNVDYGVNVIGEALSQTINNVQFSFEDWSTGSTDIEETFTPTSNTTYTANFDGTPQRVTGFLWDCDIGENIQFHWDQHPHSDVKYRIYRKPKTGSLTLVTTLNNNITSYTDPTYIMATSPPPSQLFFYDARAYYEPDENEATSGWHAVYTQIEPRGDEWEDIRELAASVEFQIGNYPNPFNLSTTLLYSLPEDAAVTIKIYDIMGRETIGWYLPNERIRLHKIQWDGKNQMGNNVPTGVYLYSILTKYKDSGSENMSVRKLILMK